MDKEKIEKLEPLEESKYKNIDLDHLIMYTMEQLGNLGVDLSFENAVVAAFKLFPKKFSLSGFPEYPDSNRIEQCLWRCTYKTKQWLGGKSRQGFIITDRSRLIIKESNDLLSGASSSKVKTTSQTRRKEALLSEIESTPAYLKYSKMQGDSITESDLCYLLQGTLDSPRDIIRSNYLLIKSYTEELKRKDILDKGQKMPWQVWKKEKFVVLKIIPL